MRLARDKVLILYGCSHVAASYQCVGLGEDLIVVYLAPQHHRIPSEKMPVVQGLLTGSSSAQGCVFHQQTRVPGRLPCSRRSPSSRLSLNARTQLPAASLLKSSARSSKRHFQQRKQSSSCPHFLGCGCRQTTVCGAGTAHPEEVSWNVIDCSIAFLLLSCCGVHE